MVLGLFAISATAFALSAPIAQISCSRRAAAPQLALAGRGTETDLTPGEDLYVIVGVQRTASNDEIRTAYRQKARILHPDVSTASDAPQDFRRLSAAAEILLSSRREAWHMEESVVDWPLDMNGPPASSSSPLWIDRNKWGPIWTAVIGPWLSWYVFVALDSFLG